MTSIDQVIARSRMSGGFSERKRFTVARRRGIEKLRKFALADPHYYVLELIQAAIANHAEYVDLRVDRENATLSYIGGGLTEHELGQLFDFLFASKDRSDIGHVRELALGLNAALLFKPDKIVVESGDATLAGSTRMVVMGDHDVVEVGRPEKPMGGTFISIQGMKRNKLGGKWFSGFNESWPREYETVEERCLAAPVPIVVGDTPLFGWSSQRTPALFGYKQVLSFDEGELYGTLGLKPSFGNPEFRLLTWGVAIQSRSHVLIDGQQIGGIICFDRLHKTVDHSGIVDDERLAELWERLRPYARQLVSGKKQASPYGATMLGQTEPLLPAQLRALVRGSKVVVAVPPGTNVATPEGKRAAAVGHALAAPVVCIEAEQTRILPVLAGGDLGIVRPDLDTEHDPGASIAAPPRSRRRAPGWPVRWTYRRCRRRSSRRGSRRPGSRPATSESGAMRSRIGSAPGTCRPPCTRRPREASNTRDSRSRCSRAIACCGGAWFPARTPVTSSWCPCRTRPRRCCASPSTTPPEHRPSSKRWHVPSPIMRATLWPPRSGAPWRTSSAVPISLPERGRRVWVWRPRLAPPWRDCARKPTPPHSSWSRWGPRLRPCSTCRCSPPSTGGPTRSGR